MTLCEERRCTHLYRLRPSSTRCSSLQVWPDSRTAGRHFWPSQSRVTTLVGASVHSVSSPNKDGASHVVLSMKEERAKPSSESKSGLGKSLSTSLSQHCME